MGSEEFSALVLGRTGGTVRGLVEALVTGNRRHLEKVDGGDSDEDDKWQRRSEVRTLGGRAVVEKVETLGGSSREQWKGRPAKDIIVGVREVVGDDR